jgi:hypothetical protein
LPDTGAEASGDDEAGKGPGGACAQAKDMVKARKKKTVEPVRKTVFTTTLIFHLFRIPVAPEKVPARNPFFEKAADVRT